MLLCSLRLLAFVVLAAATKDLPAVHGPPKNANPLTFGFYATPEVPQPVKLDIVGTFPKWLSGSLYRGGAATWDVGNYTAEHWFDGFSRNHRFEIADGKVSYRNRNATTELRDFVQETGRYPYGSFGSDPCKVIFGAFESHFRDGLTRHGDTSSDNVNVAFAPNFPGLRRNTSSPADKAPFDTLVVTTDANSLQQIDPVTLEPIEVFTYQAQNLDLTSTGRSAAHPAHFEDGSLYNYVLDLEATPPEYRVFGLNPTTGRADILATIKDAPPAYVHTLFSTKRHLILVVWQADLVQQSTNIVDSLGPWDPKRMTLFYVIDPVNGGIKAKYASEMAFFAFHRANSFENKDGDIILDMPIMKDASFLRAANVENLRANVGHRVQNGEGRAKFDVPGTFTRFRLPKTGCSDTSYRNGTLKTHKAETVFQMPFKSANMELPRIHPDYDSRDYRYAYGVHLEKPGFFVDSIVKVDVHKKKSLVWSPKDNGLPSEPVFVPRPNGKNEDDGIVLTVVMDSKREKSSLVAIDPKTMKQVAEARLPVVMGFGFHGVWGGM